MRRSVSSIVGCGVITVGCSLSLGLCAPSAGASEQGPPASMLLSQAIADAESAGWVHEVTVDSGKGHRISMDDDIGTSSGRQVIDDNGGHMTVLVVEGLAYVQGDSRALERDLGAPSVDAARLAGQWLSIPSTNQLFSEVSDAVTMKSDFSQARLIGPLSTGREVRIGGTPAIPITGTVPGGPRGQHVTGTLYVSAGGKSLPLEFHISSGGIRDETRWTSWGARFSSTPPTIRFHWAPEDPRRRALECWLQRPYFGVGLRWVVWRGRPSLSDLLFRGSSLASNQRRRRPPQDPPSRPRPRYRSG